MQWKRRAAEDRAEAARILAAEEAFAATFSNDVPVTTKHQADRHAGGARVLSFVEAAERLLADEEDS